MMTNKALSKKRIDEAQETLEAITEAMGESMGNVDVVYASGQWWIYWIDGMMGTGDPAWAKVSGITLHDAYINALHAKAGTEPSPF